MAHTVIHFTDTAGFGGAEQSLLHLLASLDRRYWRPVLFHHDEPGIAPLLAGASSLDIPTQVVPRITTLRDVGRLRQFTAAIRHYQPAIFHAHLTWVLACKYGLLAANLARVPAVVATQQLCPPLEERAILRVQPRLISLGVDRYLAVSQGVARQLARDLHIPQRQIRIVYNGIRLDGLERKAMSGARAGHGLDIRRPVILTVARLAEQKGLGYLLEAAAQVPGASFVLAGDGPERARLEALARHLGIQDRVFFLGFREDIADLMANCDLVVLPSLYEGLPLTILEAMAAGKPVIASAIPGNDEAILPEETGLLVPPANPAGLAEAIQRILNDTALARRLAAAGQERARRNFSAVTMAGRVQQVYNELLTESASRQLSLYRNRWRRPARLGTLRRTTPLSDYWGYDRGTPVDRYYIERFLEEHRDDIQGRVLGVMNSYYIERYGSRLKRAEVLDIDPANPQATIIADLAAADSIAEDQFDCFILTQTLQLIYAADSAIRHAYRILKPGGVLLVTVPVASKLANPADYWRFTPAACTALFGQVFGHEQISVRAYGNVLTTIAFLTGMAWEELEPHELSVNDPRFPLIITIRAVKRALPPGAYSGGKGGDT